MKGERIRYQQTGHFLTFSRYRRRTCLSRVAAMELFEDILERVRLRHQYRTGIRGYVEIDSEWCARAKAGNFPSGCDVGRPATPPRSPKARDRGHPQLNEILYETGATRPSFERHWIGVPHPFHS